MPSATLALLRLTPRDRLLVKTLAEVRFLTVHQVRQICYPGLLPESVSHRLSLLRRCSILDRLGCRTFDDRRVFWGLGVAGRFAAGALTDGAVPRPAEIAVGAVLMDHLIATNQVFCDLWTECLAGRLRSFFWLGSHHARMDLGLTHLTPDAIIAIPAPGSDWWVYYLERDRGTMSAESLTDKCRRYRLLDRLSRERAGDSIWDFRAGGWLLVACDDERRATVAAQAAADAGLERVWSGRADECAASLAAAVRVMPVPHVGLEHPTVGVRALPGFTGGVPYPADDWAADGRVATPGVVDPGRPSSGAAAVLVHAVGPVLAHAVGARPRGGTEEIGTSSELGHGLPGCPSTKEGSV